MTPSRLAVRSFAVLILILQCANSTVAQNRVRDFITTTERLAKPKRLLAYQQALSRRNVSPQDRQEIIKALASHLRRLSNQ